jgi:ABC-type phosphate transport system substrate-binding protein
MAKFYLRYLPGIVALFFTCAVPAENLPVFVVVNPTTSTRDILSRNALSAIFGMRLRKWEDGSTIKVFVLPDEHPLHIAFSKHVLRVFPYQLRNAWDRLVFSGTGEEPIRVASEQQMRAVLSTTPGAIGYLNSSMIDETVKVISLE